MQKTQIKIGIGTQIAIGYASQDKDVADCLVWYTVREIKDGQLFVNFEDGTERRTPVLIESVRRSK